MAKDILKRPRGLYRTLITKVKVLNFLSDGQPHGQREIRRCTATSPSTVNKFLREWVAEGKVKRVSPKKRPKYCIMQQGRNELARVNQENVVYKKRRLTSNAVRVTVIPSVDARALIKFPISVVVGATKGTPDPLSVETQNAIKELMAPVGAAILKVLDYTKADSIEVRCVVGSPQLEKVTD